MMCRSVVRGISGSATEGDMHNFGTWAIVLLLGGATLRADGPHRKVVSTTYPVVRWSGAVADPGLERTGPKDGLITSQKEFDALWKAWGVAGPAAGIDFGTHFLVVATRAKYRPYLVGLFNYADGDSTTGVMCDEGER